MQGLNRFDGINYRTFLPKSEEGDSIDTTIVNFLQSNGDVSYWIGTNIGLYAFDRKTGEFEMHPFAQDIAVNDLLTVGDSLWLATLDGIRIIRDDSSFSIKVEEILKEEQHWQSNLIHTLHLDHNNSIWIGTRTGLIRTNPARSSWEIVHFSDPSSDDPEFDVLSLTEDAAGNLWIGTARRGFYRLPLSSDPNNLRAEKMGEGNVIDVFLDSKQRLWVGKSHSQGLDVYDLHHQAGNRLERRAHYDALNPPMGGLSDSSVFTIYEDREKNIWVGTFSGGLSFFPSNQKKFEVFDTSNAPPKAISSNIVNGFYEDEIHLWIGNEHGLERLNKSTGVIEKLYELPPPHGTGEFPVFAIEKAVHSDHLWIGTWAGGLFRYDPESEHFHNYLPGQVKGHLTSENIFAIKDDGKGNLWLGTIGGRLTKMNIENETFQRYDALEALIGNAISDVLLLSENRLLIADYSNLVIMDTANEQFTNLPLVRGESFIGGSIYDLFKDSNGHVWIASSKGLEFLDLEQSTLVAIRPNEGYHELNVRGIQEDLEGNLWLSTRDGLVKFINGASLPETPVFLHTDEREGLSGNEFRERSIHLGPDGHISAGTTSGFTRFLST